MAAHWLTLHADILSGRRTFGFFVMLHALWLALSSELNEVFCFSLPGFRGSFCGDLDCFFIDRLRMVKTTPTSDRLILRHLWEGLWVGVPRESNNYLVRRTLASACALACPISSELNEVFCLFQLVLQYSADSFCGIVK